MSYTDLRDFEAEYARELAEGFTIAIEKLGGGTVGQPYKGVWRYRVTAKNTTHAWQRAPFTGNTTCEKCDLLPLDQDDIDSPCIDDVIVQGQNLETGMPKTHAQVVDIVLDCAEVDGMQLREWIDAMTMD